MREITDHVANPANDRLKIEVTDDPGFGGANHRYEISGFYAGANNSAVVPARVVMAVRETVILFQNGPIPEYGVNGITQEALLAIVIDRLRCFQAGPFACAENHHALRSAEDALQWLKKRTFARINRGIEGTHVV